MLTYSIYTRSQLVRAVNLAALIGWAAVAVPISFYNPRLWFISAVIGLPIAFALCWLIGAPILKRIMRKEVSWLSAAVWGAVVAAMIFFLYSGIYLYAGWLQSQDPGSYSQVGGGDYIRSIDGILTQYGWKVQALDLLVFALKGMVIGIFVRWAIGPGSPNA